MPGDADATPIDPVEFCSLLKAAARHPPRLSRDLEPDLLGIDLKGRILDAVIADAPAARDFEAGLLERAAALGIPAGSARGICSDIVAEWRMAHASPAFLPWLRAEAARPRGPPRRREGRGGEPAWRERPGWGLGGPAADEG